MAFAANWPAILNYKFRSCEQSNKRFSSVRKMRRVAQHTLRKTLRNEAKSEHKEGTALFIVEGHLVILMVRFPRFYGIYGLESLFVIILTALGDKGKR